MSTQVDEQRFATLVEAERVVQLACDALLVPGALAGARCEVFVAKVRARHAHAEIVVLGDACTRSELRSLRQAGISSYVVRAPDAGFEELVTRLREVLLVRSQLGALARQLVGLEQLKDAQERLRSAMFDEAYRRSEQNKGATARLLGVTRAAVQKIARTRPCPLPK